MDRTPGQHKRWHGVSVADRFWAKVDKSGDCWIWQAAIHGRTATFDGYGFFWIDGQHRAAHRVAYELVVGPVPAGLELDHVKARGCVTSLCVRPEHLEPVTRQENIARSDLGQIQARRTHCPRGHAYDEENTQVSRGQRTCRACRRIIKAAYRDRHRVAA